MTLAEHYGIPRDQEVADHQWMLKRPNMAGRSLAAMTTAASAGRAWRVQWERVSSLATSDLSPGADGRPDPTRWTIHGERLMDDTRRLRLSVAQVELPDGVRFDRLGTGQPPGAQHGDGAQPTAGRGSHGVRLHSAGRP